MDAKEIRALEDRVARAENAARKSEENTAALIASGSRTSVSGGSSDEQRCLRYFGAASVKQLLETNTGDPRYKHVPEELKGMVRELKSDFDISRLTQQLFHGEQRDVGDMAGHVKGILDGSYHAKHVLAPKMKAFGSTVSGAGDEWVPTMVSSQFIEEFELDRQVVDQFKTINMPSSPFDVPIQNSVTQARIQPESCDPADNLAAANFGTSKLTLQATKLVETMCLPEELNEDSAVQILSLCRTEVSTAQARAWEAAIMNGDTTGTHMDSDVTAASDARKAWKGLRKLALANSATVNFSAAAVSVANLRAMRTAMGKFGVSERNLTWIVSSKIYNQFLALPEVSTVEKFGPNATILRGALAALDGIPIVISEYARDDLTAAGVNAASLSTFASVMLVNRSRFMWGVRRPIRVRATMDPTPPGDRWLLASWWRGDFKGMPQSATEVSVVLGRNVL